MQWAQDWWRKRFSLTIYKYAEKKNTKKNSKLFLRGRTIINHPRHIKCFCCLGISIDYIKSKYLVCAETKKPIEKFSGILVYLKNLILRAHITIISTISLFIDSICNLLYILFFQCTFILVWNFEQKSLWVQRWFINVWVLKYKTGFFSWNEVF